MRLSPASTGAGEAFAGVFCDSERPVPADDEKMHMICTPGAIPGGVAVSRAVGSITGEGTNAMVSPGGGGPKLNR